MLGNNVTARSLTAVSVWPLVCHGQEEWFSVLQFEVLIIELSPVHALPALAVTLGEVAGLHHEVLHHAVEVNSLVVQRLGKVQLHNDGRGSPEKAAIRYWDQF